MPTTVIIVNGTSYGRAARLTNRIRSIDSLVKQMDEGDDELAFSLVGVGPIPLFSCGMPVSLTVDGTTVFVGDLDNYNQSTTDQGWMVSCTATGLKTRAARVPVTGTDGSGTLVYNRPPNDPDYVSSGAGLSVGQIVERALEVSTTATALNALSVGNYTAGALPSATTTDLAALTIVPPSEVSFSGDNLFGQIEGFIKKWHPKYAVWLQPNGTIRVTNLFTMSAQTLTVPGAGTADPVSAPQFSRSTQGCFTKVTIKGRDIQKAELSLLDESLVRGWSGAEESAWTFGDFIKPKDARDEGVITALTSTTATCDPTDASATAATNYWTPANRAGWIQLYWDSGDGIDIFETRAITASTSLSAGGTYVITWDASQPISHTNYTKYRIVGRSGGLIDVGRLYLVKEKNTGVTGLNTYVGSHLTRKFPRPVPWANNGKSFDIDQAAGLVQWSLTGNPPYIEWPVEVEVVPSVGGVRFKEPVFRASASPPLTDTSTFPTTYAGGKPVDVRVAVAYNRGTLTATKPSSSWEGTAYTERGLEREKVINFDGWTYVGDKASMESLAQEHLDVIKDEIIEGSITYYGYPSFDPLTMGYSLNIGIQGVSGPLDGIDLPVRTVTVRWPQDAATTNEVVFRFSNRRRPFEGDDLYVHPSFYFAGRGGQEGSPFEQSNASTSAAQPLGMDQGDLGGMNDMGGGGMDDFGMSFMGSGGGGGRSGGGSPKRKSTKGISFAQPNWDGPSGTVDPSESKGIRQPSGTPFVGPPEPKHGIEGPPRELAPKKQKPGMGRTQPDWRAPAADPSTYSFNQPNADLSGLDLSPVIGNTPPMTDAEIFGLTEEDLQP